MCSQETQLSESQRIILFHLFWHAKVAQNNADEPTVWHKEHTRLINDHFLSVFDVNEKNTTRYWFKKCIKLSYCSNFNGWLNVISEFMNIFRCMKKGGGFDSCQKEDEYRFKSNDSLERIIGKHIQNVGKSSRQVMIVNKQEHVFCKIPEIKWI